MVNNNINNFFVTVDCVCDYIPVVSTLNNLTDLFQKCVILPFMSDQVITKSHYFTHVQEKSILRCVILFIPIIGNIIIGMWDIAYAFFMFIYLQPIKKQFGKQFGMP